MPVDFTAGPLPSPEQMRNFLAADAAARRAARLHEASRSWVTGAAAAGASLGGVSLSVIHTPWLGEAAPFVLCVILWGSLGVGLSVWRRMDRRRATEPVLVRNRQEVLQRQSPRTFRQSLLLFLCVVVMMIVTTIGWSAAFRHLPETGVLISLLLLPAIAVGYYVIRVVQFRFWEDGLNAVGVVLAYVPVIFKNWDLLPISLLSLPIVAGAAVSLHGRWVRETGRWTDDSAEAGGKAAPE